MLKNIIRHLTLHETQYGFALHYLKHKSTKPPSRLFPLLLMLAGLKDKGDLSNTFAAMGSTRKEKIHHTHSVHKQQLTVFQRCLPWFTFALVAGIAFVLLAAALFPGYVFLCPDTLVRLPQHCLKLEVDSSQSVWTSGTREFDCLTAPQASPVVAHWMDEVKYPFFLSLLDFGTPKQPNRNMARLLQKKPFLREDISSAIQGVLENLIEGKLIRPDSVLVDVGAGIGAATFAAAAMGVRVLAIEPIFESVQRVCDGIYLNRASHLVRVHLAAASEEQANITVHKKLSHLEHSAVKEKVTKLADTGKNNLVVPVPVEALSLDNLIPKKLHVAVLKVTVQGWELHALRGASELLRRPIGEAPFLIYEEDRILLRASNTSKEDIRQFLKEHGYFSCEKALRHMHCRKDFPSTR